MVMAILIVCPLTDPLLALILGARSREVCSGTTRLQRVLCLIFPCFLHLLALLAKTPFLGTDVSAHLGR
jgi:hypothetical protein